MNFRRLTRNALFSVAQTVLSGIILFELYRFLTRHLTIADIGVWSLVMASTAVGRLSEFGLGGGVVKFVAGDRGAGNARLAVSTVGMAALMVGAAVGVACLALYIVLDRVLTYVLPDSNSVASGHMLLPYALAALLVAIVANVFLGALDGCQRSDLRGVLQVATAAVQLGAAYWVVPRQGLAGLGWTQVAQSMFLLMGAMLTVLVQFRLPLAAWLSWNRSRARELFSYGSSFQVAAVGQLLFDPAVKALLSLFGGLALTGYYELASRMILQLRGILVSAYSALVPYIAHRIGAQGAQEFELCRAYLSSYRLLVVLAVPYYGLIGVSLPPLLAFWLGRFEPQFLTVAVLCWAGWMLNTMVGPSYFLWLAIGRLRWTVASHIVIGALTPLLGGSLGWLFGGYGVVTGAMIALVAGSYVSVFAFHREYHISVRELLPRDSLPLLTLSLLASAMSLGAAYTLHPDGKEWIPYGSAFVAVASVLAMLAWRHPGRAEVVARLRAPLSRTA